jgi:predicted MFS family arabinose efflux permease
MSRIDVKKTHEPRLSGDGGFRSLLTRDFLLLMLVGAFAEGAFINISTYITTFFIDVRGISPSLSSIIFGLGPLAGIAGAFSGGVTGNKYGTHRGAAVALLVSASVLAMIPQFRGVFFVSALYILFRAMVSASMALLNALVATANASNKSLMFSIYFVVASIAGAIVPSATSFLIEARGVSIIFPLSIILLIPTIALIILLKHSPQPLASVING